MELLKEAYTEAVISLVSGECKHRDMCACVVEIAHSYKTGPYLCASDECIPEA